MYILFCPSPSAFPWSFVHKVGERAVCYIVFVTQQFFLKSPYGWFSNFCIDHASMGNELYCRLNKNVKRLRKRNTMISEITSLKLLLEKNCLHQILLLLITPWNVSVEKWRRMKGAFVFMATSISLNVYENVLQYLTNCSKPVVNYEILQYNILYIQLFLSVSLSIVVFFFLLLYHFPSCGGALA